MMKMIARGLACVLLATFLTSCANRVQPKTFNLSGYSVNYKRGHADGCVSADGSMQRDDRRYKIDADYMMGWNDGRDACK